LDLEESNSRLNKINEELHNFPSIRGIIRMIKSRGIRWVVHVVRIIEMRNLCTFLIRNEEEGPKLEKYIQIKGNLKMDFQLILLA
jgi:hypothetical protein